MTGLSSRTAAGVVGVIVVSDPWRRVGEPLAVGRDGPGAGFEGISFEYSRMLREALRRNGFCGAGDSDGIRLTGLLTLC
jgi:hypothetical protein